MRTWNNRCACVQADGLCWCSDSQQDPREQRVLQDADGRAGGVVHKHRHVLSSLQTHKHTNTEATDVSSSSLVCVQHQSDSVFFKTSIYYLLFTNMTTNKN